MSGTSGDGENYAAARMIGRGASHWRAPFVMTILTIISTLAVHARAQGAQSSPPYSPPHRPAATSDPPKDTNMRYHSVGCCDRMLPSFLVLGERKCATTSFFDYLLMHPQVLPPVTKEPGYFSKFITSHTCCNYAKFFPTLQSMSATCMKRVELTSAGRVADIDPLCRNRSASMDYITGEATATTLTHADPIAVRHMLPEAKLFVLVRCPVQRLISHYRMYLRFQAEGRAGYRSLEPITKMLRSESLRVHLCLAFRSRCNDGNLISPGYYASWLKYWAASWSRTALLTLFTEELAEASQSCHVLERYLHRSFAHIGMPSRLEKCYLRPTRWNAAAMVTDQAVGMQNVSIQEVLPLVCPLLVKWNLELADWLGRRLPPSWMCTR